MDAAADDEIAQDTEENQKVNAQVKPRPGVQDGRETNEGCSGERAGRDQHEAAVKIGIRSPVDSQGKRDREGR